MGELAKELAREKALREVEEMRLRRGFQKTDVYLTGKMNDILKEHADVDSQINQSKRRMNELRSSLDGDIQKRLGTITSEKLEPQVDPDLIARIRKVAAEREVPDAKSRIQEHVLEGKKIAQVRLGDASGQPLPHGSYHGSYLNH